MLQKKKALFDFYFGPLPGKRVAAFHINKKRRNLFLTVTDLTGSVLGSVSAKSFVLDRRKRFANHIIKFLVRKLVFVLKAYRIDSVRLFLRVAGKHIIKTAISTLRFSAIKLTLIIQFIPVPHNGCRKKKTRRL